MKRLLSGIVLLALVGCGGGGTEGPQEVTSAVDSTLDSTGSGMEGRRLLGSVVGIAGPDGIEFASPAEGGVKQKTSLAPVTVISSATSAACTTGGVCITSRDAAGASTVTWNGTDTISGRVTLVNDTTSTLTGVHAELVSYSLNATAVTDTNALEDLTGLRPNPTPYPTTWHLVGPGIPLAGRSGGAGTGGITNPGQLWTFTDPTGASFKFTINLYSTTPTVFGQLSFAAGATGTTPTTLNDPHYAALSPAGEIFVSDTDNHRVLRYTSPFTSGQAADLVLGQPDFITGTFATTATGLRSPSDISFDSTSTGPLYVADAGNNRVVRYTPPFASGQAADLVLGQPDFITGTAAISLTGLSSPQGLTFNSSGLYVADAGNHRVLRYGGLLASGMAADRLLGQSRYTDGKRNRSLSPLCPTFPGFCLGPSSLSFYSPHGVLALGSDNIIVVDSSNNRILNREP